MSKLTKLGIYKGVKPLAFYKGNLFVSKGNKIFCLNKNQELSHLYSVKENFFRKLINNFRFLVRLMRTSIYSAIVYQDELLFTYRSKIFSINIKTRKSIIEHSFLKGRGPLQFSKIEGIKNFDDSIVFGEYISNHQKSEVHIYKRNLTKKWDICYTFKNGEINHIHGIVADKYNQCVWILTGDFGSAAAIWVTYNNFQTVEAVVRSSQKYRVCIAFPIKKGMLLYATDTQLENNQIRTLTRNSTGSWVSEILFDINGSCIYGCSIKDYFVFATSTEPSVGNGSVISTLFDNKPNPYIKHNRSDIILCNKKNLQCQVIISREKDLLPYRLFQFGGISFPSGENTSNIIYAYNIGSKKFDLSLEIFDLDIS